MNWKVVECNLALIAGIVILASLETSNYWLLAIRIAVILFLGFVLLALPMINFKYEKRLLDQADEKTKETQQRIKEYQKEIRNVTDKSTINALKNNCEAKDNELQALKREQKEYKNGIRQFYLYVLIQKAKKGDYSFFNKSFDEIDKDFEHFKNTIK